MARLEKDQARLDAGHRLQLAVDLRELLEEPAFAHVDDDGDALEPGVVTASQLGKRRNQLAGQIVHAEVPEVLERTNGVGLSRP